MLHAIFAKQKLPMGMHILRSKMCLDEIKFIFILKMKNYRMNKLGIKKIN